MPLVPADMYMRAQPAGGMHGDAAFQGEDGRDAAISSDEDANLQSSLEAVAAMAAAAEVEAAGGATAAVPGADRAASPAAALMVARAAAALAAASAAAPTSQPAGGRASGSQLPLLAGQSQLVSLAPPSLAGNPRRSEAPAATMAAAAQSLSLGLPSSAGAPTRSVAPAAAAGQAAAGLLPQALQRTAAHGVPTVLLNRRLASQLLYTPASSAAPGLLHLSSPAPADTTAQRLNHPQGLTLSAAGAGAVSPQLAAHSRQRTCRPGEAGAAHIGAAAAQQPPAAVPRVVAAPASASAGAGGTPAPLLVTPLRGARACAPGCATAMAGRPQVCPGYLCLTVCLRCRDKRRRLQRGLTQPRSTPMPASAAATTAAARPLAYPRRHCLMVCLMVTRCREHQQQRRRQLQQWQRQRRPLWPEAAVLAAALSSRLLSSRRQGV